MTETLREARDAVVREHFASKTAKEFDVTLATFDHPCYEITPTGRVSTARKRWWATAPSPAAPSSTSGTRTYGCTTDTAVIAEFDLLGAHQGEIHGFPPTGRSFRAPVAAFFFFDGAEGERMVCERIRFDITSMLVQLGLARASASAGLNTGTQMTPCHLSSMDEPYDGRPSRAVPWEPG